MTPDELKSLPKGTFIVTKTGFYPMQVHLKLFFEWGIAFDQQAYSIPDQGRRIVQYADRNQLQEAILKKYPPSREQLQREAGEQAQPESVKTSGYTESIRVKFGHPAEDRSEGKTLQRHRRGYTFKEAREMAQKGGL